MTVEPSMPMAKPSQAWLSASDVEIATVPFDAPWEWLGAGWRDLTGAPQAGLPYGAAFAAVALALLIGLAQIGLVSIMLALCGGFLLIAPLVAVGLYDISRRLERGEPVAFGDALTAGLNAPGQLSFFGVALAFAFGAWLQLALLLFMLFQGGRGFPPLSEFMPMLLFTNHGLGLLVVGTTVGGLIAALVFSVSAVAVPFMLDRRVDAVTAMAVSVRVVLANPKPMALWAALIAGFMVLGIASMLVGFVAIFPLVGHATWHCYRNTVRLKA